MEPGFFHEIYEAMALAKIDNHSPTGESPQPEETGNRWLKPDYDDYCHSPLPIGGKEAILGMIVTSLVLGAVILEEKTRPLRQTLGFYRPR